MTDTKKYIKEVTKMTDNVGYKDGKENTVDDVTETQDKVFLLSVVEVGLQEKVKNDYDYLYMNQINAEGITYEWFKNNSLNDDDFWLRSPFSDQNFEFFGYGCGDPFYNSAYSDENYVFAAFVIGE